VAALYSNENAPYRLVLALRAKGHDVLTSYEAGNANRKIPDVEVLAYAHGNGRIVLTGNRNDFHQLHGDQLPHSGIVTYTDDVDLGAMASRIDAALADPRAVGRFCARVTRDGHSIA
jgi:hypothetical protein